MDKVLAPPLDRIQRDIERSGWHVALVFPNDNPFRTYFSYTVGLWQTLSQPELAVFGLRPTIGWQVLSALARRVRAGTCYTDGQRVEDLVQDLPLALVSAPNDDVHFPLTSATLYYGHANYPVLQVVIPDTQRLFPWDQGVDKHMQRIQSLFQHSEQN